MTTILSMSFTESLLFSCDLTESIKDNGVNRNNIIFFICRMNDGINNEIGHYSLGNDKKGRDSNTSPKQKIIN